MKITAKLLRDIQKEKRKNKIEAWILDEMLTGARVYYVGDDEISQAELNRLKKAGFSITPKITSYVDRKIVFLGNGMYKKTQIERTSTTYKIEWTR